MNQKPNRVSPRMPTQAYRTHAIRSPLQTHYRSAQCAEVACEAYTNGWQLRVENLSPELLFTAKHSGRNFTEMAVTEGETYLVFEPGQPCFAASTHVVSLERPEFFFVGRGDFRSFTTRKADRFRSDDWLNSFQENLDKIHREIKKG